MAYFAKSESPIALVEKPDGPPTPPLVIWGPGDPRPTLPIAGWNPGTGTWPPDKPPTEELPPQIWGPTDPRPSVPIAEPPWGWGSPAPKPPIPDPPRFTVKYIWTVESGWQTVLIPTGPTVTPSGRR